MPQDVSFFLPFPRARPHPEADRARAHHLAWVRSFGLVRDPTALRRYRDWRLTDLACYAFPEVSGAELELVTDAVCLGFPLDDQFDGPLGRQPERAARLIAELAAIPYRSPGAPPALDTPLAHAYADVWRRTAEGMPAGWRRRAAGNLVRFFEAYLRETRNRRLGLALDEAEYVTLRRTSVGTVPCFDLIERAHHFPLPDHVYGSREVQSLIRCAGDVIFLCNDVHSVEREEARGEPHNLVLIRERTRGCTREEATAHVRALVESRVRQFLALTTQLQGASTEWGLPAEGRAAVARYVRGLCCWMAGNQQWGVVSARYAPSAADVDVVEVLQDLDDGNTPKGDTCDAGVAVVADGAAV